MDKYIIDKDGNAEEHIEGCSSNRPVHFPLCLAVKYEDSVPMECSDFLLNTTKGKLFIPTDEPFPAGSKLKLHFYIPPKTKLLAEFSGKVVDERNVNTMKGNLVTISDMFHIKLYRLEQYLEEERHLLDEMV